MELLKEGTYTLPPEFKAKVIGGNRVVVEPRTRRVWPEQKRCRDCEYHRIGKKCTQNQWRETPYCIAKPKRINGNPGFFYCAPDNRVACYLFKPKTTTPEE